MERVRGCAPPFSACDRSCEKSASSTWSPVKGSCCSASRLGRRGIAPADTGKNGEGATKLLGPASPWPREAGFSRAQRVKRVLVGEMQSGG